MGLMRWANERAGRFNSYVDIKLVGLMGCVFGLLLARVMPALLMADTAWYVGFFVLSAARPIYLELKTT